MFCERCNHELLCEFKKDGNVAAVFAHYSIRIIYGYYGTSTATGRLVGAENY
ncbi:MAG: hypothetical protein QG604_768 [Candidatus Dependentiae bacterium]|nr:hypothetical protein [Candidatus Dependentiae bacterium]